MLIFDSGFTNVYLRYHPLYTFFILNLVGRGSVYGYQTTLAISQLSNIQFSILSGHRDRDPMVVGCTLLYETSIYPH